MKFDCGETSAEWSNRRQRWHRWFAWYRVRIASHDCRWLEYVERKGTASYGGDWDWIYRVPELKS